MSFIDVEVKFNSNSDSKFKKTEFMSLTNGAHTVRLLNDKAKTVPTHFFNRSKATVLCLGDECPICANNKKLYMQFNKEANKQPEYNKVTYRFYVNVLDKTPAKTCTKCGLEYKDIRNTVCSCGEILPATATPLNKVKVIAKGLTLRDDLDSVSRAILDNTGTPVPLTSYDMVLMVTGAGTRDAHITPVPRPDMNEPTPEGLELFDLERATIKFDASEMLDLQRGVSLKDIFSARKNKQDEFVPEQAVSQETIDQVNDAVSKLFNQD